MGEDDEVNALTQSHADSKSKKKKRKKKKKHKKKKKQVQNVEVVVQSEKQNEDKMEVEMEAHDININQQSELNMGFDDEELNAESGKHIELTKDEMAATMNDLQMELMKQEEQEEVIANNDDDTFIDAMDEGNNQKNEDMSDHIVGNGNAPSQEIVEN